MKEKIIISGFGGQGIMLLGRLLCLSALQEKKEVSLLPCYGAEVRGGTAYCMVTLSDKWIASPFVECADTAIFMNEPSLKKFLKRLHPQGVLILNSSLIRENSYSSKTFKVYTFPFTDIASRIGDIRVANIVALGLYIRVKKIIKPKSATFALKKSFKERILNVNLKALEKGLSLV